MNSRNKRFDHLEREEGLSGIAGEAFAFDDGSRWLSCDDDAPFADMPVVQDTYDVRSVRQGTCVDAEGGRSLDGGGEPLYGRAPDIDDDHVDPSSRVVGKNDAELITGRNRMNLYACRRTIVIDRRGDAETNGEEAECDRSGIAGRRAGHGFSRRDGHDGVRDSACAHCGAAAGLEFERRLCHCRGDGHDDGSEHEKAAHGVTVLG